MPRGDQQWGLASNKHSANVTLPPDCHLYLKEYPTRAYRKKEERNTLETWIWDRLAKALHVTGIWTL